MAVSRQPDADGGDLRRRLDAAHAALLRVHKAVIDHERTRYEHVRGPVGGPMELLQLVLNDPWFAWLRPISELIVQIDTYTASREPIDIRHGEPLFKQAQDLLVPDESGNTFAREYFRAMQESPDIAVAHGEWRRTTAGG